MAFVPWWVRPASGLNRLYNWLYLIDKPNNIMKPHILWYRVICTSAASLRIYIIIMASTHHSTIAKRLRRLYMGDERLTELSLCCCCCTHRQDLSNSLHCVKYTHTHIVLITQYIPSYTISYDYIWWDVLYYLWTIARGWSIFLYVINQLRERDVPCWTERIITHIQYIFIYLLCNTIEFF